MQRRNKPPQWLQKMFAEEWRRAKKLVKPFFDEVKMPRLYTAKSLRRGWLAYHVGRNSTFAHKINGRWVKTSHLIVIREDHLESEKLRDTIRHEICHVKHNNHKWQFQLMLRGLNAKLATESSEPLLEV